MFLLFGAAFLFLGILSALHFLFMKNVSPSRRMKYRCRVRVFLLIAVLLIAGFIVSMHYVEDKTTYSDPETFDTLELACRHGTTYFRMSDKNKGHIATIQVSRCDVVIDYYSEGMCTLKKYSVTKRASSELWGIISGVDIFYLIPNLNVHYEIYAPEEYLIKVIK